MQKIFWRIFQHSFDFFKERVKSLFFVFQFFQNIHSMRKRKTMRTPSEFAKNLNGTYYNLPYLNRLYENIAKEYNKSKEIRSSCDNGAYPLYHDYVVLLLNADEAAKDKN